MKKCLLIDKMLSEEWACNEKEALAMVMTGKVLVDDYPANSIKEKISVGSVIRIKGKSNKSRYITRAGRKLEKGLSFFPVSAEGMICADIGAAEGGFTDCLLKYGAEKVYAVDVAYGILDWSLRNNEKVVVLERTNARYLSDELIPDKVNLLTSDVSFISLRKILPAAINIMSKDGIFIVLYKPQFELKREQTGKNGNVENNDFIAENMTALISFLNDKGIFVRDLTFSPVRGSHGNIEYLLYGDLDESNGNIVTLARIVQVMTDVSFS
ncbi:MAG: TlyA family RNA methyltransferase [Lachnospiraceae bacterium]|nr:TlyA family RNA methyltransferase [Lachnospiraceae bacterium]